MQHRDYQKLNPKTFPIGSVCYFVRKNGHRWDIKFGTVEEHYPSAIVLQLYDLANTELIDGVPIEEFQHPTPWKKLPKGWSYDTELFKVTYRGLDISAIKLTDPQSILRAIQEGILIKVQDKEYGFPYPEVTSEYGWRIVFQYDKYCPSYVSLQFDEVYETYEEAQSVVDAHIAELERQAALSDLEWSIEQIDHNLDRAIFLSEENKKEVGKFLLSQDRVEDIETRIYMNNFQWKYKKNRRWVNTPIQ